jgi:cellulose synthase/poly-beta-1,6-N-acetylglucosamine synthase-like glycosyltransferase
MDIPETLEVELIVMDNGSTDATADVIRCHASERMRMVHLFEARKGKAHACNSALKLAQGDILLWTDDDVRVPRSWLVEMTGPLREGRAEGVSGRIRMAAHLERKWMRRTHYFRLADNRFRTREDLSMVGANMAFARSVLERVPQFEPELGPGRAGQRDDTLFSHQMLRAGFRICQTECEVEHFFEESRLLREAWLRHGEASGRSSALVRFHWEHQPVRYALLWQFFWGVCLWVYRIFQQVLKPEQEGCERIEIRMVEQFSFFAEYRRCQGGVPKYSPYGLVPLRVG